MGALAPTVFCQTVNPISTRGTDYAHHSTTSPPGFSDQAATMSIESLHLCDNEDSKIVTESNPDENFHENKFENCESMFAKKNNE